MNRREFLVSTASALALLSVPSSLGAVSPSVAVAVVITGVSAETDPAKLFAVIDVFLDKHIWSTCAVRLPGDGEDEYRETLKALLVLSPEIETAVEIDEIGALSPYFQARAAFEARNVLGALGDGFAMRDFRTIVCASVENPTAPTGIRSAGFRNVLVRPDRDGPTRSEHWSNGVARFFGGVQIFPWSANIPSDPTDTNRILYLPAEAFSEIDEDTLQRWATKLSHRLLMDELAGKASVMPASEIQFRDNYNFSRFVAVQLMGERSGPLGQLGDWLEDRGIPARYIETGAFPANGLWVPEALEGERTTERVLPVSIACRSESHAMFDAADPLRPGVGVVPVSAGSDYPGLAECSVLYLLEDAVKEPIGEGGVVGPQDTKDDFILSIYPEAVPTRFELKALQKAIEDLSDDGISSFVDVSEMTNAVLTHTPIDTRYRRTIAALESVQPGTQYYSAADIETLMEDAKRAWTYFEKFTNPVTGLCPAATDIRNIEESLNHLTMWDVGSQINGIIAAHQIGLIDEPAFEDRIRRVLRQIAGRESNGRLLPQGVIRSDRDRWGNRDFDGCDVGRLLASLDHLRRNSGFEAELTELVEAWDLGDIVLAGEIHSVTGGELESTYTSHCAHYSARAFERWGVEALSPYRTFDGRTRSDGEVALLEVSAGIGPLGAEPLLLEALELGMSPESAYLADVLLVAQIEEFDETGDLLAVSETPINRSPWFIYQGLQLGRETREWAIDTVDQKEEYRTKEFLSENMAVSSKAAFLWAAYNPGPYADALLETVRENAALEIGFSSNINRATGKAAPYYTDLNTNGIILQAIAYILANHRER